MQCDASIWDDSFFNIVTKRSHDMPFIISFNRQFPHRITSAFPFRLAVNKVLLACILLMTTPAWSQSEIKTEDGATAKQNVPMKVTIKAKIQPVQTSIDRKVYSVKDDLQAVTGSAADILNTLPSVDVDADGNVSLRGAGKVMILVDGRPSAQLSGSIG